MTETITKEKKTLRGQLLAMKAGERATVLRRHFTPTFVRMTVKRLNGEGHAFRATERGCLDGIIVERLR